MKTILRKTILLTTANYLILVKFHPQNSFRNGGNRDCNRQLPAAVIRH